MLQNNVSYHVAVTKDFKEKYNAKTCIALQQCFIIIDNIDNVKSSNLHSSSMKAATPLYSCAEIEI